MMNDDEGSDPSTRKMTFRNHDKECFDENKNVNMRKGLQDAL